MKKSNMKIKYDTEADVLSIEQSSRASIDHATEMGSLVVHFSKKKEPVLVEVLEVSELFRRNKKSIVSALALTR